jgi:voltage-gated potassium channel
MASLVTQPVTSDFLDMVAHGGELEFRLYEIRVPARSRVAGRTLADAEIRTRSGALVLAIRKENGAFDMQPNAASMVGKGDTLVVIGTPEQIEALETMLG